jgi:hypothetical protein
MEASQTGNDALLAQQGVEIPGPETAQAIPVAAPLATPDITKAQLVGSVPVIANLLTAFHVFTVTPQQQHALELAVGGGVGLFIADALIRVGRSLNKAKG